MLKSELGTPVNTDSVLSFGTQEHVVLIYSLVRYYQAGNISKMTVAALQKFGMLATQCVELNQEDEANQTVENTSCDSN